MTIKETIIGLMALRDAINYGFKNHEIIKADMIATLTSAIELLSCDKPRICCRCKYNKPSFNTNSCMKHGGIFVEDYDICENFEYKDEVENNE